MLQTGRKLYNPTTRKAFTFVKSAKDTNDEYVTINCTTDADGGKHGSLIHAHPKQTEIITVVSGAMTAVVNGKKTRYDAGEMLVIKPGDAHSWWNASKQQELNVIMEVRPALQTEQFIETFCNVAQAAQNENKSSINILKLAVLLKDFSNVYALAGTWAPVKKFLINMLATLGKYKGYTSELATKQWTAQPVRSNNFNR